MMSTLEAAQEIRSLASDGTSFGNHKDLQDDSVEPSSEPHEQIDQDLPPDDAESEVNAVGTDCISEKEDNPDKCLEPLSNGSAADSENNCENVEDESDVNFRVNDIQMGNEEPHELKENTEDESNETPSNPPDINEDLSEDKNDANVADKSPNSENDEFDDALDANDDPQILDDKQEISECPDAVEKSSDPDKDSENMETKDEDGESMETANVPETIDDISENKQDEYPAEKSPAPVEENMETNVSSEIIEEISEDKSECDQKISGPDEDAEKMETADESEILDDISDEHSECEKSSRADNMETEDISDDEFESEKAPEPECKVMEADSADVLDDISQDEFLSQNDVVVDTSNGPDEDAFETREKSEDKKETSPVEEPTTTEDISQDVEAKLENTDDGEKLKCEVDNATTNEDVAEETSVNSPSDASDVVPTSSTVDLKKDDEVAAEASADLNEATECTEVEDAVKDDDVIDLDDMLKEIGVDSVEAAEEVTEESKESPEVTSSTDDKEKKEKIDEDDDVIMMDVDDAPTKADDKKEKSDEDLEEDLFKECDELLKSIAEDKDVHSDHAISLDEDSSDEPKKKIAKQETNEAEDKDAQSDRAISLDEDSSDEPKKEIGKEETNEAEAVAADVKEQTEVPAEASKDDEKTFDAGDKSQDMANSSDDILIIDDEAEVQGDKAPEPESSVKDDDKDAPEKTADKVDEIKATEMEIEEDATAPKEEPPKSTPSAEPIPIDDDDLSMDKEDGMSETRSDSSKKRPSNSIDYDKTKRMKLSDDSEKDTDTNSQSSIPSKRGVDLQDSTSRASDRDDDSDLDTMSLDKRSRKTRKTSHAEKDVGSLLTPLPKKTSMDFVRRFKKPFQDMSHADLEEFVLQKIAELITHKSEYSEMRKKLEKQEEMIVFYRTKLGELSKNFHDLEVVYKRVQQDLDNRNAGYVQIPKITRAVGLQVSVSSNKKQHMNSALAQDASTALRAQMAAMDAAARKAKPIQRFTPMRPPMSEAEQRNLDAQEQKQRQESLQQMKQTRALNAATSPNAATSIAPRTSNIVVLKHTPKSTPAKVTTSPQPYIVKRTATGPVRTATVTSTVVTKTISPAGQSHAQRVIISPSSVAPPHMQQTTTIHKVPMTQQQRPMSVVTPPKKQVVVDLTDEDDMASKVKVGQQQPKPSSVAPAVLNGNIPALVAIPSSSATKPTTKYVMVQQMSSATNGQLPKAMPNKYGTSNRIKMPIAPKPVDVNIRGNLGQPTIVRRPPIATTIVSTGQIPTRPLKLISPQRNHPAPLPPFQNQPSQYGMKRIPTRPVIRIKNDEKQGIVISWTMDDLTDDHEDIRDYQIYAYQETTAAPSTDNWRLVGDVKSMMLPMAVTLSQFQEGQRYWFAVRARDIHERCGMFSVPRTW